MDFRPRSGRLVPQLERWVDEAARPRSARGDGHATHALTRAGETEATLDRRDRWVSALATVASRTDRVELRRRYRVVDDDYAAVRAMLQANLVERPSHAGARTAGWLHGYWYYRGRLLEAVRWLSLAVAVDDAARLHTERGLAVADRIAPEHRAAFGLDVAIQAGNMWSAGDYFLALAGEHRTAVVLYSAARAQMHREGLAWRSAPETSGLHAKARAALDPADYEQAWREGEDLTLSDTVHTAIDLDGPAGS